MLMDGVVSLGQSDALPQKFRQAFARSATAVDALHDMGPELLGSLKGNVYIQRRPKPGHGCVDESVGRSKGSATLNDKLGSLLRKSCSPSDLESVYIAEVMAPPSYHVCVGQ
jgi:hypothetical protein